MLAAPELSSNPRSREEGEAVGGLAATAQPLMAELPWVTVTEGQSSRVRPPWGFGSPGGKAIPQGGRLPPNPRNSQCHESISEASLASLPSPLPIWPPLLRCFLVEMCGSRK